MMIIYRFQLLESFLTYVNSTKLDDFLFLLKNAGQISIVGKKKKEKKFATLVEYSVGGLLIGARKCSITKKFAT